MNLDQKIRDDHWITEMCANNDFSTLFIGAESKIVVYSLQTDLKYKEEQTIQAGEIIVAIIFNNKNGSLIAGLQSGEILIFKKNEENFFSLQYQLKAHSQNISTLYLHEGSDLLFSGSFEEKKVIVWRLDENNQYRKNQELESDDLKVCDVHYDNESGNLFSACGDHGIIIWSCKKDGSKFKKTKVLNN